MNAIPVCLCLVCPKNSRQSNTYSVMENADYALFYDIFIGVYVEIFSISASSPCKNVKTTTSNINHLHSPMVPIYQIVGLGKKAHPKFFLPSISQTTTGRKPTKTSINLPRPHVSPMYNFIEYRVEHSGSK